MDERWAGWRGEGVSQMSHIALDNPILFLLLILDLALPLDSIWSSLERIVQMRMPQYFKIVVRTQLARNRNGEKSRKKTSEKKTDGTMCRGLYGCEPK